MKIINSPIYSNNDLSKAPKVLLENELFADEVLMANSINKSTWIIERDVSDDNWQIRTRRTIQKGELVTGFES
jgi:hypothetical protein